MDDRWTDGSLDDSAWEVVGTLYQNLSAYHALRRLRGALVPYCLSCGCTSTYLDSGHTSEDDGVAATTGHTCLLQAENVLEKPIPGESHADSYRTSLAARHDHGSE